MALFVRGLALARKEVVDVTGDVSEVDAALCESAYKDALFGAAAPVALDGEIVGVVSVPSAGVLVPDLKSNSSRACVSLSAGRVCSPVGSMHHSGTVEFDRCDRVCLLLSVRLGRDACCVFLRSKSPFQRYE